MTVVNNIEFYKHAKIEQVTVAEEATIAVRQFGQGHAVVFIHGFPTSGYTWRHLLPILSCDYHCITLDLPGLGDSNWSSFTDFTSTAQARYIAGVLNKKGIDQFTLVAHNSGATVARILAINEPDKVKNLFLINTEIPDHRPPWIPFYQLTGLLPFIPDLIRRLLKQEWFIKSPMGFQEAYTNKSMLENPHNIQYYLTPLITSRQKIVGAFKYLKGIEWKVIDDFKTTHRKIKAKVVMIWGEDDKTFPLRLALEMKSQFNDNCQFHVVKKTSLLPHEEKPEEVGELMLKFLSQQHRNR